MVGHSIPCGPVAEPEKNVRMIGYLRLAVQYGPRLHRRRHPRRLNKPTVDIRVCRAHIFSAERHPLPHQNFNRSYGKPPIPKAGRPRLCPGYLDHGGESLLPSQAHRLRGLRGVSGNSAASLRLCDAHGRRAPVFAPAAFGVCRPHGSPAAGLI